MRLHRVVIGGIPVLLLAFAIYLGSLYGQLRDAFNRQEQFIPTRIYSDVTKVAAPQTRGFVETKLKNLAYTAASTDSEIRFTLHTPDYPAYLIPDGHPQLAALTDPAHSEVKLSFSGPNPDDLLQSIQMGGTEIQDFYLEPELVTTFTRSGNLLDAKKEIRTHHPTRRRQGSGSSLGLEGDHRHRRQSL